MESKFEEFVRELQPNAGCQRLYRQIALDAWRNKQGDSELSQDALSDKVKNLREKQDQYWKAFVYQKAIDAGTDKKMRAKLTEEFTLAEMELRDAQAEETETEAVLDFAQMVLLNASNLGKVASSEQKQPSAAGSIP